MLSDADMDSHVGWEKSGDGVRSLMARSSSLYRLTALRVEMDEQGVLRMRIANGVCKWR